ncbi:SpoVR family protein [Sulfidibacter corallicola]|uniref:SpoVR family protein n=1 Tax=Sulfidibacter corallicola TaxID=2818388 RepID=A0A8A4TSR2_SULCO|nr:SpoVR family protein [Sulfidibacter corallicola]QTD52092.1 SpoVR family protein [Sulfidibacter corallicola]
MRMIHTDEVLNHLKDRVLYFGEEFGMTLPEVRFYILDGLEFASLLEKRVYPASPSNIWEGKRMVSKKYRISEGMESSLYYEVVQTGNPSYAYLNNTNSPMMQASVMAHVLGHCEFSELNVLRDSNPDRTEFVMFLVKKVNLGRHQMGEKSFISYWNAAESALPMMAPNSQYNVGRAVESDTVTGTGTKKRVEEAPVTPSFYTPLSSTLDALLRPRNDANPYEREMKTKLRQETLSRRGFRLRCPCQDVFAFLRYYAPTTNAERSVLDYLYTIHAPSDFVVRTQIMNEGWAMYWEKKIMLELFKERACTGIIDYSKVFSGVCYPRPYYMRNPYHLGFHMWCHVEELYRDGKVSLDYHEEKDQKAKDAWKRESGTQPIDAMRHLVRTVTDYEYLRRFLTPELIHQFHLNRVPQRDVARLGISKRDVIQEDRYWVWLNPEPIKKEMLKFFTHFYRPRIYVIDADFEDGGLLLFHRDDGRRLKANWIQPTLKNLNMIWKGGISLVSKNTLYGYTGGRYREMRIPEVDFEVVVDRMRDGKKPLVLD